VGVEDHRPRNSGGCVVRAKLTHVAIRFRGKVYSLPAPSRHHHVIAEILKQNPDVHTISNDEQGFLDESGTFLNRKQALASALWNNQIKSGVIIRYEMLFSEDV
jgi:hypothetical protein